MSLLEQARRINKCARALETIAVIKELAIDGLTIDGAHHKQWYLEEILLATGHTTEEINKLLCPDPDDEDHCHELIEKGIPP